MASPSSPPVLPNGEEVHAKNTLQSFAVSPVAAPTEPEPVANRNTSPPLLPNGDEIDAKNTAGPVAPVAPAQPRPRPRPQPQPQRPPEAEDPVALLVDGSNDAIVVADPSSSQGDALNRLRNQFSRLKLSLLFI